jgi:hypothetical protein
MNEGFQLKKKEEEVADELEIRKRRKIIQESQGKVEI